MNKIKVLYDVVKAMKKKEEIKGTAKLEVVKGDKKLVSLHNEFTKNTVSGDIIAKLIKEINMDGNKVKKETNIEMNIKASPFHKFHHGIHREHGNKLSKVLFALNALDNLNVEENDDKLILSLDLKEVIKEGKELRDEFKNKNNKEAHHHKHDECIKKFITSEYEKAELIVTVNKANEIQKIELSADGENIINGSVNFEI